MVGHFSLTQQGRPIFYEILLLDEHEGGLRMRVKHFNPDFVGWEERDGWHAFEPEAVEPFHLRLKGIDLRRSGDELTIVIALRDDATGIVRDHELKLRQTPF